MPLDAKMPPQLKISNGLKEQLNLFQVDMRSKLSSSRNMRDNLKLTNISWNSLLWIINIASNTWKKESK